MMLITLEFSFIGNTSVVFRSIRSPHIIFRWFL